MVNESSPLRYILLSGHIYATTIEDKMLQIVKCKIDSK